MKKSSLLVLTGILLALVTLAAVDMKLKSEYSKKNIKEYLLYNDLPPFHYVKDDFTGNQSWEWYTCNIISGKKYGVGSGFNSEKLLSFTVKNDTLFIQKPNNGSVIDMAWGIPVTIFCGPLKAVIANACVMTVSGEMADSITAIAVKKAEIRFKHLKTSYLEVTADSIANVSVSATDSIKNIHLRLRAASSFTANNVFIETKTLQMSDSASLKLTGISLENFGIKKN